MGGTATELTGIQPVALETDDRGLVDRARNGDSAAFDGLFARHYPAAYNLAVRLVGNREDAADITQTAFLRGYRSLGSLRDGQAFRGWVFRIVVNLVRDRAKRHKRKPLVALLDLWRPEKHRTDGGEPVEFADSSLDPARVVVAESRDRALSDAIAGLPLEFREVLVLHHLQGLDVKAIAGVIGTPEGTVKSRLGRARQRLRGVMGEWLDGREGAR